MRTIPELRTLLGWSQEHMAAVLGCTQPTIDRIEGGQSPTGAMRRLAQRLDHLVDEGAVVPAMAVAEAVRLLVSHQTLPQPQSALT